MILVDVSLMIAFMKESMDYIVQNANDTFVTYATESKYAKRVWRCIVLRVWNSNRMQMVSGNAMVVNHSGKRKETHQNFAMDAASDSFSAINIIPFCHQAHHNECACLSDI
eukprot:28307_1